MNTSTLRAIRAIGAEQIRRIAKIIAILAAIVGTVVTLLVGWLAESYSGWWWAIMLPLIVITTLIILALSVVWAIAHLLTPRQLTRDERKQVHSFTDRLLVAAASAQISRSALVLLLIKDAIQGRRIDERVKRVIDEGKGLKADFSRIQNMFEQ